MTYTHLLSHLPLDGQSMRPRNGVAVKEGEKSVESIKEGPVRKKTDALVGVDRQRIFKPLVFTLQAEL